MNKLTFFGLLVGLVCLNMVVAAVHSSYVANLLLSRSKRGVWLERQPNGRYTLPNPRHNYDLLVGPNDDYTSDELAEMYNPSPRRSMSSYFSLCNTFGGCQSLNRTSALIPMTFDKGYTRRLRLGSKSNSIGLMHLDDVVNRDGKGSVTVLPYPEEYLSRGESTVLGEPGMWGISDHGPQGWSRPKHYVYRD